MTIPQTLRGGWTPQKCVDLPPARQESGSECAWTGPRAATHRRPWAPVDRLATPPSGPSAVASSSPGTRGAGSARPGDQGEPGTAAAASAWSRSSLKCSSSPPRRPARQAQGELPAGATGGIGHGGAVLPGSRRRRPRAPGDGRHRSQGEAGDRQRFERPHTAASSAPPAAMVCRKGSAPATGPDRPQSS
jgi:hypothetical protein